MKRKTALYLMIPLIILALLFHFFVNIAPSLVYPHLVPLVTSISPKDGAINVALNSNISMSFSKPMDQASLENAFSIHPKIVGAFLWKEKTLVFDPAGDMEENTTYTVIVSMDAKDLWGKTLQSPYSFSFATGEWLTLTVFGETSAAIQKAMDTLTLSEAKQRIVILPAAKYVFTSTVEVPENTIIKGGGILRNVGAVELGPVDELPYWDPPTAHCITSDRDLIMFQVKGDNVTFMNLKIEGAVTSYDTGSGTGIYVYDCRNIMIVRCELFYHRMAIWFANSQGKVIGSYIHKNYRSGYGYGICIVGDSMETGGSQVVITDCEFARNRHDLASNSPQTIWELRKCYFREADPVLKQFSVDTHPHGGRSLRFAVINCTFKNSNPIYLSSGTGEIKYNRFHSTCGNWCVYGTPIYFGPPEHNGVYVPNQPKQDLGKPKLHDIQIEGNINETGKPLLLIRRYNFPDDIEGPKPVAENVWVDGELVDMASPYIQG